MTTMTVDSQQRQTIEQRYGPLGPYAVAVTDEVTVAADDGFELKGALAMPVGETRAPTVLIRTPYDPTFFMGEVIAWASYGYACLIQSTRSTTSYFDEVKDGPATVRWIERQPWFDGRLGLCGDSYLAFAAWATASTRPACLKAIATTAYSTDRVSSWYPGGSFGLQLALSWAAGQENNHAEVGDDPFDCLPLDEADVAATGSTLDFYQERLAYDGQDPHWSPLNFSALLDDPPAPILHLDGWYDYHRIYCWQDFERLNRNDSDVPHRLVIGPWPHAGTDPRINMAERLAWFDNYVRGDGSATFDTFRYYRTGTDSQWNDVASWQEPETVTFYAGADQDLSTAPSTNETHVRWTYDPSDPTPSTGFTLNFDDVSGLIDNRALEQRPDVRTFTSAPRTQSLDLVGHITATATFFSDAPSADLFLRLVDVHENGHVQNLADGILRVTDSGLAAGMPVQVDLGPIGHRFSVGHRIRVLVASGAHPYYNRNLGNDEPIATATKIRVAHQAILVGGEDGLRISLPLAR